MHAFLTGRSGNGGSVIIMADPHEQTLRMSHPHAEAEKGANGSSQNCTGRNGENLIIRVPCGVVVKRVLDYDEEWDEKTQTVISTKEPVSDDDDELDDDDDASEEMDSTQFSGFNFDDDGDADVEYIYYEDRGEREQVVLADLDEPGSHIMVARGGRGGEGTAKYASEHGALPDANILIDRARPEPGEVAFLELELKLIADLGLVGFPNAGKSSLLRAMSRASPEVAPYPFTTLHPLLGSIDYRDGFRVKVADIPGLIDGASEGRGKGFEFLRHIERTKALVYIVDAAGVDYRNPVEDLCTLVDEIASYGDGSMLERRALVVANKIDLIPMEKRADALSAISETAEDLGIHFHNDLFAISAGVTGEGLGDLAKAMRAVVVEHG